MKQDGVVPTNRLLLFLSTSEVLQRAAATLIRHRPLTSQAGAPAEICLPSGKHGACMAFCSQALPTQPTLSNLEEPFVINAGTLLSNTGIKALKE